MTHPRDELENLLAENAQLQATVSGKRLSFAIADAGFDPTSGAGKAIAKTWPDDVDPTPDDVVAFASEEFGFEPTPPEPEMSDAEAADAARMAAEGRLDMLNSGVIPSRDPTTIDQIAAAERRGDHETANRLRVLQLHEVRRGGGEYRGTAPL